MARHTASDRPRETPAVSLPGTRWRGADGSTFSEGVCLMRCHRGMGSISEGTYTAGGVPQPVMAKILPRTLLRHRAGRRSDDLSRELAYIAAVNANPHPGLMDALSMLDDGERVAVVSARGRDLLREVTAMTQETHPSTRPLSWFQAREARARSAMGKVLSGLRHLHQELSLAHLDMSLENVIELARDGTVRIIDFGLARRMRPLAVDTGSHADRDALTKLPARQRPAVGDQGRKPAGGGTAGVGSAAGAGAGAKGAGVAPAPEYRFCKLPFRGVHGGKHPYMAPEYYADQDIDGVACDMWSFGCMLFAFTVGLFVVERPDATDSRYAALSGLRPLHHWRGEWLPPSMPHLARLLFVDKLEGTLSAELIDLLSRLLSVNPAARPTPAEALAHPWFTGQALDAGRVAVLRPAARTVATAQPLDARPQPHPAAGARAGI